MLCECGCGETAPITRGKQKRFIQGHYSRTPEHAESLSRVRPQGPEHHNWSGDKAHSTNIHQWLNRHFPKRGVCEECGKEGKTDYAFLKHPEPYTRDRDDYQELCRSCHMLRDLG